MKQLYINGTGTGDYGIYISSDTYLSAPSIEYTEYQVPGRNGNLVNSSGRLNNIIRKFDCYIPDSAQANLDEFKKLLYGTIGYMQITSDYEPDTYQLGYLAQELEVAPFLSDDVLRVTFSIYFSCQPQKYYLTNSDITQSVSPRGGQGYVLPRSHPWIQRILKQTPTGDMPSASLYYLFIGSTFTSKINSASITLPTADFLALLSFQWDMAGQEFIDYIAHSNNGNTLTLSTPYNIPSGYNMLSYALLIPFDTIGIATGNIYLDGVENTINRRVGALIDTHITQRTVLGLTASYEYKFGLSASSDLTYDHYTTIEGLLNGAKQWEGHIFIDSNALRTLLGSVSTNGAVLTIDSETLSVVGGLIGENRNLNAYVNIDGRIDGIADEIRVIDHNTAYEVMGISRFKISPRWWKV